MCGIVGYIGSDDATEKIITGLSFLEYRGYDSAGITVSNNGILQTVKRTGKLNALKNALKHSIIIGNSGIGHTRWATHGIPSDINSHPHNNNDGTISIVHNGIIENFLKLRSFLESKGYYFLSETDSEVIANLIDYYYEGNLVDAVQKAISKLEGSYALGIVTSNEPNTLVAVRNESPLVIGVEKSGYFMASDIPALLPYTRDVLYLENGDLAILTANNLTIYNKKGDIVENEFEKVEWDLDSASKNGFEHFMLKEIYEQPKIIKNAIQMKCHDGKLDLKDSSFSDKEWNDFENIYVTGCGTAYHAGQVGKVAIETWAKKPVFTEIASELKYYQPFINDKTLLVVVSQSGETGDTLAAMKEARKKGAKILSITNVVGSSIARESDKVIYCYAGPEISVASTKAYTTQLIALYMLALDMAQKLNTMTDKEVGSWVQLMNELPEKVEEILKNQEDQYKNIAQKIKNSKSIFFLGRGLDYLSAKEGALKLKEISYINSVAYPSGELKHGSIALIEQGTPVLNIVSQSNLIEKAISNIKEVTSRGAFAITIGMHEVAQLSEASDAVISIPKTNDMLTPILTVIPEQILAYETAVAVGNDVDKPRNLAKAVTVE